MELVRLPDWRVRLEAYLRGLRGMPFGYGAGKLDCVLFINGAVAAMTGTDFARQAGRGRYRSLPEGRRKLAAAGFADHADLVASILPEIHPSAVLMGDVVLIAGALCIVQGRFAYAIGPAGLGLVPLVAADRAWRV